MAYHGNVHGNVHGNDGNVQNDSLHKAFQRSCMFPPTCNCSSRMLNSSCSSSSCRNPIASGADLILQHYIAKSHEFNQALKVGEKDPQSLIEMLEPILELQETCMMLLHRAQEQPLMQNKIILIQQRSDTLGRMGIDGKIEGAQAWIMNTSGSSDESDIEEGKPKKPGKALEIVGKSGRKSGPASGSGPSPLSKVAAAAAAAEAKSRKDKFDAKIRRRRQKQAFQPSSNVKNGRDELIKDGSSVIEGKCGSANWNFKRGTVSIFLEAKMEALHYRKGRAEPRLKRSHSIGRCENLEKNKLVNRL
eukprot:TRINITY_DN24576_c0_g1_i3.p1 TRINITY_DN24576_c0_g1~~TRINITY_DN24576_c0_g1_i3.p1  ORF type:complete len:304 (+),score=50.31 TRINITY_DN24576_c0_g1_i3:72-983(+)